MKMKKHILLVCILMILSTFVSCGETLENNFTTSDNNFAEETIDTTETVLESVTEQETESTPEETIEEPENNISGESFVEDVKSVIQGDVGENETIADVVYQERKLIVYVDLSQKDPTPLTLEDIALSRNSSITDDILELSQYDDLWDEVIVDFGETGKAINSKSTIADDGYGRYFDTRELTLQAESKVEKVKENVPENNVLDIPIEYANALIKAETYSSTMNMSKSGIYNQLTSEYGEGFTAEAAQYAIDNIVADFNENALKKAETYSDTMHMSKQSIYDQLTSEYGEKFTHEEAQYAVDNLQADYNYNALQKAISYQTTMAMSAQNIYEQLVSEYGEKFTPEEAQYAVDNLQS